MSSRIDLTLFWFRFLGCPGPGGRSDHKESDSNKDEHHKMLDVVADLIWRDKNPLLTVDLVLARLIIGAQ